MAEIGALVVKIAADASELQKALGDIAEGGNKASAGFSRASKIMTGAFLATAAAALVMTKEAGKSAEELDQLSQITGISTDTMQGYEVAMNRVGLSAQDMTSMFRTLSKNVEEARTGVGEAADRFRQLGIDITKVTSTDDLMRKVIDSISRFKDGTEKAAIVGSLLGKQGLAWIPAMKEGAKALDEAARKAQEMGQLSQDQIAVLTKMDDAFDDLAMATKFFAGNLGALLAPAITFAIELMTNFLSLMNAGLKSMREFLGLAGTETAGAKGGPAPPPKIDSAKATAATLAMLDVKQKAYEMDVANTKKLNDAELANYAALQEQRLALNLNTELEIAKNRREVMESSTATIIENIQREITAYRAYAEQKLATFARDQKGNEDRDKFLEESLARQASLQNELIVAQRTQATERIKNTTAVAVAIRSEEVKALQEEVDRYTALDEVQQQYYENASIFEDAQGARIRVRMGLIEAEADLARTLAHQRAHDEAELAQMLENIDNKTQARKMAAAKEFPNFFEKQLDDLTKANQFSTALIVNQWTSALANVIVKGGDFKAVMESTEIAVVQAFLNMGVQAAATAAKAMLVNETAAATSAGFWEGAAAAITGTFVDIGTAIAAFWTETLLPVFVAIGEALMTFLSAIAEAAADTIFGIPYAVLVLAGVAVIAGAIVALKAIKFAEGGIVTSPTLAMIGESGPEAVIPLTGPNAPGGSGGVQTLIVPVYLKGKEIARLMVDDLPNALRQSSVPVYGG